MHASINPLRNIIPVLWAVAFVVVYFLVLLDVFGMIAIPIIIIGIILTFISERYNIDF
jgi:hypothetical protein